MFLFDTGPLLCFAATGQGPQLLRDRYHGNAAMLSDIGRELQGLTRNRIPPVAKAAQGALNSFTWIEQVTIDDQALLDRADALRTQLRAFKRYPDRDDGNSRKDWGELTTIAHAESLGPDGLVVILANDSPARELARTLGITTACAVDILRALVRDEKATRKEAFRMYKDMTTATLDPGDVLRAPNDL